MRILTRYVLFDLLKVFSLTLTGLTLLIFIVLIGKEAVTKGLAWGRCCGWHLSDSASMQFAVPGTMLLRRRASMAGWLRTTRCCDQGTRHFADGLGVADNHSRHARELRRGCGERHCRELGTMGVRRVFLASIEEVTYSQLKMSTRTIWAKPTSRFAKSTAIV